MSGVSIPSLVSLRVRMSGSRTLYREGPYHSCVVDPEVMKVVSVASGINTSGETTSNRASTGPSNSMKLLSCSVCTVAAVSLYGDAFWN